MAGAQMEVVCDSCGATFERPPSQVNDNTNFCSRACYGEWLSENNTGADHWNYSGHSRPCDNCGEEFHIQPAKSERREVSFCSDDCYRDYHRVEKVCPGCGEEFAVLNSLSHKQYCCHDCYIDDRNVPLTERSFEVSHPYGTALWQERREQALERDNHTCQRCGMDHEDTDLLVHHETPWGEFETIEEAHNIDNLTSLCYSCHGVVEGQK